MRDRAGSGSVLDDEAALCDSSGVDSREVEYLRGHRCHDVPHLLRRWRRVARGAGLVQETLSEASGLPVLGLASRGGREEGGFYFSAGIHGDEAGAVMGLLEWAEERIEVLRTLPVVILPCLNPWGVVNNSRLDSGGRDLNRNFDAPGRGLMAEIRSFLGGWSFEAAVSLHEDFDANGIYLYELARRGDHHGEALLERAEKVLPRHRGPVDGRVFRNALMRRTRGWEEVCRQIEGVPESIYLHLHHARRAFTFETPSEFSLHQRAGAHRAFLDGVLELFGAAAR